MGMKKVSELWDRRRERPITRSCLRRGPVNVQQDNYVSEDVVKSPAQPPSYGGTEQKLMEDLHMEHRVAAEQEVEVENGETADQSEGPRAEAVNGKTDPLETSSDQNGDYELILSEDDFNENSDTNNFVSFLSAETENNRLSDEQITTLSDNKDNSNEIDLNLDAKMEKNKKNLVWDKFDEEVREAAETVGNGEGYRTDTTEEDEPEYKVFSLIRSNSRMKDMKGKEIVLPETPESEENSSESVVNPIGFESHVSLKENKFIRKGKGSKTENNDINSNSPAPVSMKRSLTQSKIYEVSVPVTNSVFWPQQESFQTTESIPEVLCSQITGPGPALIKKDLPFPPVIPMQVTCVENAGKVFPGPPVTSRRIAPPGPPLKRKKTTPVPPLSSRKLVPRPPFNTRGGSHMIRAGHMPPGLTIQSSLAPTRTQRACFAGRLVRGPFSERSLANSMGTRLLPNHPSPQAPRSRVDLQSEYKGTVDQVDREQVDNLGNVVKVEQMKAEVVNLTQEVKQENIAAEMFPGIIGEETGPSKKISVEIKVNYEQLSKLRELGIV